MGAWRLSIAQVELNGHSKLLSRDSWKQLSSNFDQVCCTPLLWDQLLESCWMFQASMRTSQAKLWHPQAPTVFTRKRDDNRFPFHGTLYSVSPSSQSSPCYQVRFYLFFSFSNTARYSIHLNRGTTAWFQPWFPLVYGVYKSLFRMAAERKVTPSQGV
jgi:hypothetical protein